MKKEKLTMVEEGGLVVYADLDTAKIKLFEASKKIYCPNCGAILEMNGRCKTCMKCGWSSCDI